MSAKVRPTLGERIAAARLRKKKKDATWTQAGLARRVGVDRVTVWKWEQNVMKPSTSHALKLIDLLGLPLTHFK